MTQKRAFLFSSIASTFDHALLSGLNFVIGIVLIRFATKENYGFYTLLFGAGILSASLIEALIGSALTTLATKLPDKERHEVVSRASRLQWAATAMFAVLLGLFADLGARYSGLQENPELIGLAYALFVLANGVREFCRSALFIDSKAVDVAKVDGWFVVATLVAIGGVILFANEISLVEALLVLAVSNGVSCAALSYRFWRASSGFKWDAYTLDIKKLWNLSQWAFVGALVGWIGNNSYLYFAGAYLGIEASADLNSARLFLVPAALLAVAWARVARPVLGQMIASVTLDRLTRFTWKSIAILSVLNCLFVAIILWMLPWLQQNLLGAKYQRAPDLVPLWGVYLVLNSSRTVGTTVLMCYGWFKELFSQGLLSLVVLTLGCVILMPRFGVVGALSAMILVELIELFTNLFYLLPKARSRH